LSNAKLSLTVRARRENIWLQRESTNIAVTKCRTRLLVDTRALFIIRYAESASRDELNEKGKRAENTIAYHFVAGRVIDREIG